MTDDITIQHGVPDGLRHQATRLYAEALKAKLQPLLGDTDRASRQLSPGLRPNRAIVALRDNRVVGIAGFKAKGEELFDVSCRGIWREYGLSALPRTLGLLLSRREEADTLLMDGIAVDPRMRSRGIGARLLDAICLHAALMNRRFVRLDVIDTNPRARALYARKGFIAEETRALGPLRALFPFRSSTTMRRPVERL